MKDHNYRFLLTPEPEGGFTVAVPMLPGCITYGKTIDECMANAEKAIELYIESLKTDQKIVPTYR